MQLCLVGRSGRVGARAQSPAPVLDFHAASSDVSEASALLALRHSSASLAVLHAGGVLQDGIILRQRAAAARAVAAPKTGFLSALTRPGVWGTPLQAICLFSSVSAFIGSPGQAVYSGINAALDAWAGQVARSGLQGDGWGGSVVLG